MMSQKPIYLTPEGRDRLKEELEYLRTVRRPQVAAYIQLAKEGGDIMDNAGYDDAKNEQAFVEGRIATLQAMLKNSVLIEEAGPSEVVILGSWVKVAVTVVSLPIVTVAGLCAPLSSPLQPANVQPVSASAVRVTTLPYW